jgi:hypothetical protein
MQLRTRTHATLALLAFVFAASLAHEATAQLHAVPVTDAAKVYELDGYRVQPPPGRNWFELRRDRQQALFGKKITSPTHSFVATATSGLVGEKFSTREQFLEYVNKLRTADVDAKRFRIIEVETQFDDSFAAWCVRYRLKRADRDAVLSRNRTLILEDFGVACLHPDNRELVVDVGYSERGRAAELDAELRAEGERFMRGLVFIRQ